MTRSAYGSILASRRLLAAFAVLVLLAALLWPIPAVASDAGTWTELRDSLNSCGGTTADPTTVTLAGDITQADGTLTVGCVAELDLNGHALTVANVVIDVSMQFTIRDGSAGGGTITTGPGASGTAGIRTTGAALIIHSGTVTATGGFRAAAIGGNDRGVAGSVTITGGTVIASHGSSAAGIGGGYLAAGGPVTISGGDVTATGGAGSAGIGGGYNGAGRAVTISGGQVDVTGGGSGAGIGGGFQAVGGPVTISGGDVTATGGNSGAGIGSGREGAASGTVIVSGGTVAATGGDFAAGVGGGLYADGGSVTISGGAVTVTGGSSAAGIGGGYARHGGAVEVGSAAEVTARGGSTAIGAGGGSSSFGSLSVAGTLHLPGGELRIPDGIVVTVADTAEILGSASDPTSGAGIVGSGSIANQGVIALAATHVTASGVTVSGHHYRVAFDAAGGTPEPGDVVVFAPSFEAGHRTLPTGLTRGTDLLQGWTDQADGAGSPIVATSDLRAAHGLSAGTAVPIAAYAHWTAAPAPTPPTSTPEPDGEPPAADPFAPVRALPETLDPSTMFSDVAQDATHAAAIAALAQSVGDAGPLLRGHIDGTFGPQELMTRGQIASVLHRALTGAALDGPSATFLDELGDTHGTAIRALAGAGILTGHTDGTFGTHLPVTRGQLATMMVRAIEHTHGELPAPGQVHYLDVEVGDTHARAIGILTDAGILNGHTDTTFGPEDPIQRDQAASYLARWLTGLDRT